MKPEHVVSFVALVDKTEAALLNANISEVLQDFTQFNRALPADISDATGFDAEQVADFLEGLHHLREARAKVFDLIRERR